MKKVLYPANKLPSFSNLDPAIQATAQINLNDVRIGTKPLSTPVCFAVFQSRTENDNETHLAIKPSKKNFGGILRPKYVRRTLVIGLIYGPRANTQFDIAFWVFWILPGPLRHSDSLILSPDDCDNNLHVWKLVDVNARPQGHRHLLARPSGIFCCAKALGLGTHFGAKALGCPGGDSNLSNWYLHNSHLRNACQLVRLDDVFVGIQCHHWR